MKPELLRGSTMKFGRVGRAYVCIHPAVAPSDEDWKALLADVEPQAHQITGSFVYCGAGFGPDAVQRKQVAEMWARVDPLPPIAVVTPSPAVRAMVTALNYFMSRAIREFPLEAIDEALAYVSFSSAEHRAIKRFLQLFAPSHAERRPIGLTLDARTASPIPPSPIETPYFGNLLARPGRLERVPGRRK